MARRKKTAAPKRPPRRAAPLPPPPIDTPTASGAPRLELSRGSALPAMHDPKRRESWGLPADPHTPGPYMIELNLFHPGGLAGAKHALTGVLMAALPPREGPRGCIAISEAYLRCELTVAEWRQLIELDETREHATRDAPAGKRWARCIYRIWPDFQVRGLVDRSVSTVKADAALRSFNASGKGIVWAVVDSGIDATHPHFGAKGAADHRLTASSVVELHRDFLTGDLDTADGLAASRRSALTDPCGHGTHVAGILSGRAPARAQVYERVYTPTSDEEHEVRFERRSCDPVDLRGVAPDTRLVSLRVLDEAGNGRASDVIRALVYLREQVNANPRTPKVHGVNLSVGYEFDAELFACGQSPLCAEVDRLVKSGVVVVTAAGNTGYGVASALARATRIGITNSINDPGNAALAITVGATHRDAPYTYGVSYFSSKGPTGDGRLKPDLVAPGERITSCATGTKHTLLSGAGAAAYVDDSGTSMAAPHVSGAIAAFLSIRREFIGKPDEIKRVFLDSATPLGRERYFEGHGLVDLMRALTSV